MIGVKSIIEMFGALEVEHEEGKEATRRQYRAIAGTVLQHFGFAVRRDPNIGATIAMNIWGQVGVSLLIQGRICWLGSAGKAEKLAPKVRP